MVCNNGLCSVHALVYSAYNTLVWVSDVCMAHINCVWAAAAAAHLFGCGDCSSQYHPRPFASENSGNNNKRKLLRKTWINLFLLSSASVFAVHIPGFFLFLRLFRCSSLLWFTHTDTLRHTHIFGRCCFSLLLINYIAVYRQSECGGCSR